MITDEHHVLIGLLRSLQEHVGYLRRLQGRTLKELTDEFALHMYDYLRREGHLPPEKQSS